MSAEPTVVDLLERLQLSIEHARHARSMLLANLSRVVEQAQRTGAVGTDPVSADLMAELAAIRGTFEQAVQEQSALLAVVREGSTSDRLEMEPSRFDQLIDRSLALLARIHEQELRIADLIIGFTQAQMVHVTAYFDATAAEPAPRP